MTRIGSVGKELWIIRIGRNTCSWTSSDRISLGPWRSVFYNTRIAIECIARRTTRSWENLGSWQLSSGDIPIADREQRRFESLIWTNQGDVLSSKREPRPRWRIGNHGSRSGCRCRLCLSDYWGMSPHVTSSSWLENFHSGRVGVVVYVYYRCYLSSRNTWDTYTGYRPRSLCGYWPSSRKL